MAGPLDPNAPLLANPMLAAQVARARGIMRPDVTDLFGYGPTWETYWANSARNFVDQFRNLGTAENPTGPFGFGGMTKRSGDLVKRAKTRVGTTGQYVGAPPGVDSPQKFAGAVRAYAQRVKRALDEGLEPGWFYGGGARAIRDVTDSQEAARQFARLNAITSSEAPVAQNVGWAIRGIEQNAMGAPINTGKYPNKMRSEVEELLGGTERYMGHKRERYGAGLSGEGGLAPNDRWEIRSVGYPDRDAGLKEAQHAFIDDVRERARGLVNRERGTNLSPHDAQELNWAVTRADEMGIPLGQSARDTVQDAIPKYTFQHSWESIPGATTMHLPEIANAPPKLWQDYHNLVKGAMLDPATGKDTLVQGMGGRLLAPTFDTPGFYKGAVSPGSQSRSLVYHSGGVLDPASRARVEGTEMLRALFLGQDAAAGHLITPSKTMKATDTAALDLGRTLSTDELKALVPLLNKQFGDNNVVPVGTPRGANLLSLGAPNFGRDLAALEPQLRGVLGQHARLTPQQRMSVYEELPWSEGRATARVIEALRNPAAPRLAEHASSERVRDVAGRLARIYERFGEGGFTPNRQLSDLLRAWQQGGLPAAEALVKKGLAPAAALAILAEQDEPQ